MNTGIYILGIILQAVASIIAMLQIRRAPDKLPWFLISLSSLLIVVRRASTLGQFMKSGRDLAAGEILTLLITVLFFLGVIFMTKMFRDFSRSHEKLQKSEERYATALRGANDAVWDWDLKTDAVAFSSRWKMLLGYSEDEIKDHISEWEKLGHPDDYQLAMESVKKLLDDEINHLSIEMRMRHKNGTWVYFLTRGEILRSINGEPLRIIGTHADITERKLAENILKELSNYSRNLIETSLDPLVTINAAGEITDVNAATEAVTGVSRNELIGSDFSDYFTDPVKARDGYSQAFAEGFVRDYPLSIKNINGKITDVLYNAAVYKNEDGTAAGVFAAARDITERKVFEEALKELSSYSRNLIETSLDPLVTINAAGEITDVNAATEAVTGVSRNELIGSDFSDYFTDPVKAREGYSRAFINGFVRDYPLSIKNINGKITDVLYNAAVYKNEDGTSAGVFAAARDITERKIAEEKIKILLDEKELLLKEVHHRIKNNMSTIVGLIALHSDRLENPDAVSALNEAENRVRSMMVLYDKLYRNSDFREMSVQAYFTSLVTEIVKNFHNSDEVIINTDFDDFNLGIKLLMPLGIIINELLTNIMKYAFTGRDSGLISASAHKTGNLIRFIIEDNGCGLPEEINFENSAGFGFQLVGMLIRDIKGTIEIERNNGTRFIIEFEA